jgi:hypothetical protein
MHEHIRRAVAFAVLAPEAQNVEGTIYSYSENRRSKMSGNRNDFFDHDAGVRIAGAKLYHYGRWSYIDLAIDGDKFSGFDHDSKTHFEGAVKGRLVQLYDHGEKRYFDYAAEAVAQP